MLRPIHADDIHFASAPPGWRVRSLTLLPIVIVVLAVAINAWFVRPSRPGGSMWPVVLAPLPAILIVAGIAVGSAVRGYRVTADELQAIRFGRVNRFPLAGLQEVAVDRYAMQGARKRPFGNDGLGAMAGRFRSDRLGDFEVLVTDPDQAVVLRWADRRLVVSPNRPQEFAETVRARAGLRG